MEFTWLSLSQHTNGCLPAFMQDASRRKAPSGVMGILSSLFFTTLSLMALVVLFGLGSAAIRRYSGGGAGAVAGGPSAAITGPGGASYAPKEYNKVCTCLFLLFDSTYGIVLIERGEGGGFWGERGGHSIGMLMLYCSDSPYPEHDPLKVVKQRGRKSRV